MFGAGFWVTSCGSSDVSGGLSSIAESMSLRHAFSFPLRSKSALYLVWEAVMRAFPRKSACLQRRTMTHVDWAAVGV